MTDYTFSDGEQEEIYKMLRHSEALMQHFVADGEYAYHFYRPYWMTPTGDMPIPVFLIGGIAASNPNPMVENGIASAMVGGVIEAPIAIAAQGGTRVPGDLAYCAYNAALTLAARPYLTTDPTDGNIVTDSAWGVIIHNQSPIHFGEDTPTGTYATLRSVRILTEAGGWDSSAA